MATAAWAVGCGLGVSGGGRCCPPAAGAVLGALCASVSPSLLSLWVKPSRSSQVCGASPELRQTLGAREPHLG